MPYRFPQLEHRSEAPRIAVYVRRKAIPAVTSGHPWLFDDSIERIAANGKTGDIAVLFDTNRNFLAAGLYDPASPVRVKIFSHSRKLPPVGPDLFRHLAQQAAALRAGKLSPDTDAWRVIHGDSDSFPGLVVDKYANALVCKIYSAALLPWTGSLAEAIAETVPGIDSLVIRLSRELQRLPESDRFGISDGMTISPDPGWNAMMQFRENGITFEADLKRGQKTGFFLDQRDNRKQVST
ncbi:MAG: 23S rRNA (cytosine(2499)-C(5))-methyltransferase, partial [Lentisphaeria bacterium]|nr:23S rRNA (cytosine(2499)-C(5))-methyltransferase [Lentisphaeria bacterium]